MSHLYLGLQVNHGRVKIKTEASLSNLKLSDIIIK